jgi:hypothetical protein
MPGQLNQHDLLTIVDELYFAGIPSMRFLDLNQAQAERYAAILNMQAKYSVKNLGLSLENDPSRLTPKHAVELNIKNRRQ